MLTKRGNTDVEMIRPGMRQYPDMLREIPDFPKQLYCKGNTEILGKRCVAVVGSRNTTNIWAVPQLSDSRELLRRPGTDGSQRPGPGNRYMRS